MILVDTSEMLVVLVISVLIVHLFHVYIVILEFHCESELTMMILEFHGENRDLRLMNGASIIGYYFVVVL